MDKILAVGMGGAIGALLRYKVGGIILHRFENVLFPVSTFVINLAGCLLIGFLAGMLEEKHIFGLDLRLFILTGLLGGFTTFSAFGFETIFLMKRGAQGTALSYVALSVLGGLLLVWMGERLGHLIA